jgi:putative sterol carrier protein
MLPFEIPTGTTARSLFETVLPNAHKQLVPLDAGTSELTLAVRVGDDDTLAEGGSSLGYTFVFRGSEVTIEESERPASLWIAVHKRTLDRFLGDWMGPRRFAPKFTPRGGALLLTDPRIMKRLVMVTGRIELALPDFEGERASFFVGAGGGKKVSIEPDAPDVVLEATVPTFERLLAGTLPPDEAIGGNHVTIRGKKLVAMQFAFALAPFFPVAT